MERISIMELSPKAVRYLIDAVKYYENHLDHRLDEENLSDDESADLANDRQYLIALVQDLQSYHENLLKGRVSVQN